VPTLAENISVAPKFGQTQEQLAADRAECQLWAKSQTGFDPTQYGGGVPASDYNLRRPQSRIQALQITSMPKGEAGPKLKRIKKEPQTPGHFKENEVIDLTSQ